MPPLLGFVVFNLANLWKSASRRSPSAATQAATMEAFLPLPDRGLEGEVTLGSLAFVRDQYHRVRAALIDIDAADETHAVLNELKTLAVAPLKTLLVLRRGRESTHAKKERSAFGSAYVALQWNPNDEDAAEQLGAAIHDINIWMRGNRSASYPYSPARQPEQRATVAEAAPNKARTEFFKKKKRSLDFTAEVLKGKPQPARLASENSRIVQRISEHSDSAKDKGSKDVPVSVQLGKLTAEIRDLKKSLGAGGNAAAAAAANKKK
jgi:hypothetical protein